MKKHVSFFMTIACAAAFISAPVVADASDGEKLFKKKCGACHKMEKHGIGPMLKGVMGRKAGSTDFGKYKGLKDADFIWDETSIDGWIANPKKFIGKRTSMSGKTKKPEDRAVIIEYLKSESD